MDNNTTEIHLNMDETSQLKNKSQDSTKSILESKRICLIGTVVDDVAVLEAAKTFGVPIITSEHGTEYVEDNEWITYFVTNDFDSTIFDAIHKSKHKILGPPVLLQAAEQNEGLPSVNRPIYNYAMKGVITCFTGIRKKDELTRLVHLIHSMGGSIRKDMNSKVTHLICNTSGGDKYQYAMTFRLSVIRPEWVYKTWENRNDSSFIATSIENTQAHKVKAFEGQRICFLGFPEDEKLHMIEVLEENGGIKCDIEDIECTHVIIPNSVAHFPQNPSPLQTEHIAPIDEQEYEDQDEQSIVVDEKIRSTKCVSRVIDFDRVPDENGGDVERMDVTEFEQTDKMQCDDDLNASVQSHFGIPPNSVSTPTGHFASHADSFKMLTDGVVLRMNEDNEFINPNNISPILSNKVNNIGGGLYQITEDDDGTTDTNSKRKRDSFDNLSILSTDSFAAPHFSSAKKPKLIRTGSITRKLGRSMSFAAIKTPVSKLFSKSNRNSVDPNASISSITSLETTFNESIKKPIKDKFRGIRDKLTRSGKKDISKTSKYNTRYSTANTNENFNNTLNEEEVDTAAMTMVPHFKTPNPPSSSCNKFLSSATTTTTSSLSASFISSRHSVGGTYLTDMKYEESSTTTIASSTPSSTRKFYVKAHEMEEGGDDKNLVIRRKPSNCPVIGGGAANNSICSGVVVVVDANHPVVDEHVVHTIPDTINNKTHILKADWFWYTIQNGFAPENDYKFDEYLNSIANSSVRRDSHPSINNKRKRKRLSQRFLPDVASLTVSKRRSSVSDAGLLSLSSSFLDCSTTPDKHESRNKILDAEPTLSTPKSKSMRFNHFMDFFHTESNYVGILDTILTLFKIPLETTADANENEALLNKSEIKSIFSNFLPIHQVHKKMLNSLKEMKSSWNEECLIGQIILDNRNDLIKAYPPYVNFFEQMKEALIQCDKEKPRFHAFLKINQSKPECGRQTLQDLMIRPVQRLPSISLLLNDILKHTTKGNPDHKKLDEALKAIKEVMTYINEDKRKMEGQLVMFDIFNDIENCPPALVSSHRRFISKCDVTELSNTISGRGDSLTLFLFSDAIEICKKRSRGFNSAKSPSSTINSLNTTRCTTTKSYKHNQILSLSCVRFVYDIRNSPRAFALRYREAKEEKERTCSFNICDEVDKIIYLKELCKQLAENACRADADNFLSMVESNDIDIDISEINLGTLSKAFKFATRTRLKVGRAFSFNKTPSKVKRGDSKLMASPFGSTNSIQAPQQMANIKIGSCMNINEIREENGDDDGSPTSSAEVLVAPHSVQPVRKAKSSTLSLTALRRI